MASKRHVRFCVCLSVNMITPEPLEISSLNSRKDGQVRKWLYRGARVVI